jgi:outer membrane receptor protein involved in Fe transport
VLTAGAQTEVFKGEGELEQGNKAELTTWTVAVEDQYWITRTLSLAAGGIYSYFDQTLLDRSSTEFNPQVALAWQTTASLSLHASAAQRTRFPKLRELYRDRYGNPDLEPQTSENYELGLLYRHANGWTTDCALFHSDIDGLIERTDRRATYTNFEPVTIDGVEAATGGWWNETFFTQLGYTFVDAKRTFRRRQPAVAQPAGAHGDGRIPLPFPGQRHVLFQRHLRHRPVRPRPRRHLHGAVELFPRQREGELDLLPHTMPISR